MSDAKRSLRMRGCTEMSYRITVPVEVFNIKSFAEAAGSAVDSNGWKAIRRAPKSADYHIHVYWKIDKGDDTPKAKLQVDFHMWPPEWHDKPGDPFAEDFFHWAGQFFSVEKLTAHIHSEFEFPNKKWESKIMALPIEVPYAGKTAAIMGLSIRLHSEPEGTRDVWISKGKENLTLQLFSDRLLEFKTFDPLNDVDAFVSVAKSLMEEKKV